MKVSDYFAELHVAGRFADAGWNVFFPHRDKGFDFIATKTVSGQELIRPIQAKGKYPSGGKSDKAVYGYVGRLTQTHPEMALVIPFFPREGVATPLCIAYMPLRQVRRHSRGYRCQPASYQDGRPVPRRDFQPFFDEAGLRALDDHQWASGPVNPTPSVRGHHGS